MIYILLFSNILGEGRDKDRVTAIQPRDFLGNVNSSHETISIEL